MITVENARQILDRSPDAERFRTLSDAELEQLLQDLYGLATVVCIEVEQARDRRRAEAAAEAPTSSGEVG